MLRYRELPEFRGPGNSLAIIGNYPYNPGSTMQTISSHNQRTIEAVYTSLRCSFINIGIQQADLLNELIRITN